MKQKGLENYNKAFYTRKIPELRDWMVGRLRGEDMSAAILYALGLSNFNEAALVLELIKKQPFKDQSEVLWAARKRRPKFVFDIGCGRGETCAFFASQKVKVVGTDPSPGSKELARPTLVKWVGGDWQRRCQLWNEDALVACEQLEGRMKKVPDTVLLIEALEHIPKRSFRKAYEQYIVKWLRRNKGLFIVTNWLKYHPIRPNPKKPWCHVTVVNDGYYDWLQSFSRSLVFRDRSHLVLQF